VLQAVSLLLMTTIGIFNMWNLIFVEPWPWWVSGPAVGLFMLAFLYWGKKPLGASGNFTGVLEAMQGKGGDSDEVDFSGETDPVDLPMDPREKALRWRVWMIVGI